MESPSAPGATFPDFGRQARPGSASGARTLALPDSHVTDALNAAALAARTLGSPTVVVLASRPWVVRQAHIAALQACVAVDVRLDADGTSVRFAPRPSRR